MVQILEVFSHQEKGVPGVIEVSARIQVIALSLLISVDETLQQAFLLALHLPPHPMKLIMIQFSYLLVNTWIVVADKASLQEVQLVSGLILLLLLPLIGASKFEDAFKGLNHINQN